MDGISVGDDNDNHCNCFDEYWEQWEYNFNKNIYIFPFRIRSLLGKSQTIELVYRIRFFHENSRFSIK